MRRVPSVERKYASDRSALAKILWQRLAHDGGYILQRESALLATEAP
jgi:hypothetical protein